MLDVPAYISVLFITLTLAVFAVWIFGISKAAKLAGLADTDRTSVIRRFAMPLVLWLAGTATLASSGFYMKTDSMPPKILLVVGPALIAGILVAYSKRAKQLLLALPTDFIIRAQSFRIAVEVIFYLLLINNAIPALMTFEGRNMDIFVGLTAIPVAVLVKRNKLSDINLKLWNYVSLIILMNVMIHGMLSAPSPIQQIVTVPVNNFMLQFPFVWLVALLVPSAFVGHLLSLRQLALKKSSSTVSVALS